MRVPSRSTLPATTALCLSLVLGGCAQLTGDAPAGLSGFGNGDVAAQAGDVVVTVDDLEAAVDAALASTPTEGLSETDLLDQRLTLQAEQLTYLLSVAIVDAAADEDLGVTVSEADIDAAFEERVELAGGQAALDEAIAAGEVTVESIRFNLMVELLIAQVQDALVARTPVTDADVDAAFEERRSQFEQVDARHILVDTEAEALDIVAQLEDGADFGELAAALSKDPGSGANGGSLGPAPRGSFVPEFEAAIWDGPAEIGALLGPVQTQFGYHLIIVDEFVVTPEDEARETIRAELEGGRGGELFGAWVSQALSDADPAVATRFGSWDRVQQAVVRPGAADEADETAP